MSALDERPAQPGTKLAGLVEGTFGRVFRSEVRPVELARKLAREMDEHKTVSVSRTYVPNEYVVWLSPEDRERYEGVEDALSDELCAYLLEHARREQLALVSRPQIEFRTDERLSLGEFGIQARLVRPPERPARGRRPAVQADHGHTMVYSTAERIRGPVEQAPGHAAPSARCSSPRAAATSSRRAARRSAAAATATSCSTDPNVSRRHAEVRPGGAGAGRSPISARRTACASTGGDRGRQPLPPGDRSSWAPPRSRSSSNDPRARSPPDAEAAADRDARTRLRRPEVRLPGGPLPLPAVGLAQRAEGPAPRRGRRRSARAEPAPPDATGMHRRRASARSGDGDVARASWSSRVPGPAHGMEYDIAEGATLGRGDVEIHLEDPFASSRHARLIRQGGVLVLEDLGSTNGTYLNEELLRGPAAAARRRPRPHRRQHVHLRGRPLMLRAAADHFAALRHRPRPPRERGRVVRALAAVRRRRRDGRRAGGRGRLAAWRSRRSSAACARRRASAEEQLADAVRAANARIHEMSQADEARAGMGTTITAAHVGEHDVTVAHVGDSRAYRLRDGELERLTEDHSLVEEMRRRGQLTAEEADEHPQRSIITRALGPEADVEVDTRSWRGEAGDVYLLCSDGLTSMIPEAQVARDHARHEQRCATPAAR